VELNRKWLDGTISSQVRGWDFGILKEDMAMGHRLDVSKVLIDMGISLLMRQCLKRLAGDRGINTGLREGCETRVY
jgi:hypothetical protein